MPPFDLRYFNLFDRTAPPFRPHSLFDRTRFSTALAFRPPHPLFDRTPFLFRRQHPLFKLVPVYRVLCFFIKLSEHAGNIGHADAFIPINGLQALPGHGNRSAARVGCAISRRALLPGK